MNITPVIPDGYNGPVKRLSCRVCKHLFYLAMADYERLREVSYCHECSLILLEELQRNQAAPGSTARPAWEESSKSAITPSRLPTACSGSADATLSR